MNKKVILIVSILMIVSIMLSACSLTKSSKVIPEDREVESLELLVYNADNEAVKNTLSNVDTQKLLELFDNLGYIDRYISQLDVTKKLTSEEFTYALTVNIKKKGLKKAYSYYIYIGRTATYTLANKSIETKEDVKYMRIDTGSKKYKGEATEEIVKILEGIKENLV